MTGEASPLRVFLSHASGDIAQVGSVAAALGNFDIQVFLSPHHLHPADEWLPAVQDGLNNADALLAFLTPAFRLSLWTDQEVGYAFARNIPVLPVTVKDGPVPHGFLHRFQAVRLVDGQIDRLASEIFNALLREPRTRPNLRHQIVERIYSSRQFDSIRDLVSRLEQANTFTPDETSRLESAIRQNPLIKGDYSLRTALRKIIDDSSARE